MAQADDSLPAVSPDDALPPVEPPSAGFIVQLFVVPLVIVAVIVAVWLMFNRLAQMGADPHQHLTGIERNHAASWQDASSLVEDLRRDAELGKDVALARRVAGLLERLLAAPAENDNDVKLRIFLRKVLGEFSLPEAMPLLVQAATAAPGQDEGLVRQAAVEALAVLIDNLRQDRPAEEADAALRQALAALLAAADDEDALIQTSAAYALGVAGGEEAEKKLTVLLISADPAVRSNAAFGLARHGNPQAIAALLDLLDPEQVSRDLPSEEESARTFRRATILLNALRATGQLAESNTTADLSPLTEAVRRLTTADVTADVRVKAQELLLILSQSQRPAAAAAALR